MELDMATIRKRSNGSYEIKVSCGYGVDGKQRAQYKTWKPEPSMTPKQIEKEVNRQAVLFEESCKKGQITAAVKFEAFAEQWFEEYAKHNLRKTSFERMRQLTKRVYPALGHLKLDKITARHIQQFVNDLKDNGKNERNGKPLSRKTIVHHLSFISDVFGYAVRMEMICDNPCRRVVIPKGEAKEKEIYTLEEVEAIFAALENEPLKYKTFIILAVYSGFRRGEMLGLEWKDIDWEHSVISVKRTSNYTGKKNGIYTDTTKTKKSQRSLKFPPIVMDMLRQFKAEQDRDREQTGDKWIDTDRLFVKWNGLPMHNNTPYFWFSEFCEKHGFRFCDIHSLRHLHCSLLINAGIDVAAVSGDLGHSCVGTTLNLYSHMFQEAKARNCDAITAALSFGKKDEKTDESEKKAS